MSKETNIQCNDLNVVKAVFNYLKEAGHEDVREVNLNIKLSEPEKIEPPIAFSFEYSPAPKMSEEVNEYMLITTAKRHGLTAKYLGDDIKFTIEGEFWYIALNSPRKSFIPGTFVRQLKEISRLIFLLDKYFKNSTSRNDSYEFLKDTLNIHTDTGSTIGIKFFIEFNDKVIPKLTLSNEKTTLTLVDPSTTNIRDSIIEILEVTRTEPRDKNK